MQNKRSKRSRIRAAKKTAGHGSKKKNRGSGHRGGFGKSNIGKRGSAKLMKITKSVKQQSYLGKHGFKSLNKKEKAINLETLQNSLLKWFEEGKVKKELEVYVINLSELGYDKLLSKGQVKFKLNIKVAKATENAISKVKEKQGTVEILE